VKNLNNKIYILALIALITGILIPISIGYIDISKEQSKEPRSWSVSPSTITITTTTSTSITTTTSIPVTVTKEYFITVTSVEREEKGIISNVSYSGIIELLENNMKVLREAQQMAMPKYYFPSITPRPTLALVTAISLAKEGATYSAAIDVSHTNVQVEGVDELDIVKNNNRIVVVSLGSKVYIFDAIERKIASIINITSSTPLDVRGIYLYNDKLVVVSSSPQIIIQRILVRDGGSVKNNVKRDAITTNIHIFDISNVYRPILLKNISVSGSYLDSRLSDRYAYFIISMDIYSGENNEYIVPIINGDVIDSKNIVPIDDLPTVYTIIVAIDLENLRYNAMAYMTSYGSRIYMSRNNRLYIASPATTFQELYLNASIKFIEFSLDYLPQNISNIVKEYMRNGNYSKAYEVVVGYISSLDYDKAKSIIDNINSKLNEVKYRYVDKTHFYIYTVDGVDISYRGSFTVDGSLLDQFCMEELDRGFFIVATTYTEQLLSYEVVKYSIVSPFDRRIEITICSDSNCTTTTIPIESEPHAKTSLISINPIFSPASTANNVYIVDLENLKKVGELLNLAKGERIYAARLVKNIFFLVTFRQVDPLYAIDVSDPLNPKVLGYLKIPGFSEYLHPLPGDRLLGIGLEDGALKISLFNVSDPTKMLETSTIKIGNTWSPALQDHHAVTVYLGRNIAVIPVFMGYGARQGFIIISYSYSKLGMDQIIDHLNPLRSVYIGSELFTISSTSIKIYNLDSRSLEEEIKLS
jgi:uncharacterized secreted protein with C-terminal beta-propeller domain